MSRVENYDGMIAAAWAMPLAELMDRIEHHCYIAGIHDVVLQQRLAERGAPIEQRHLVGLTVERRGKACYATAYMTVGDLTCRSTGVGNSVGVAIGYALQPRGADGSAVGIGVKSLP